MSPVNLLQGLLWTENLLKVLCELKAFKRSSMDYRLIKVIFCEPKTFKMPYMDQKPLNIIKVLNEPNNYKRPCVD